MTTQESAPPDVMIEMIKVSKHYPPDVKALSSISLRITSYNVCYTKLLRSGQRLTGKVTNIADYGAFVELEDGIEGLIHVSELSWTKKNIHPGKILSTSQEVEVMVLDVDVSKRRISLGLKQCSANPWVAFAESHKAGDEVEGTISNITEFGFVITSYSIHYTKLYESRDCLYSIG